MKNETNTQHTPAPWMPSLDQARMVDMTRFEGFQKRFYKHVKFGKAGIGGKILAKVFGYSPDEAEANAQLIARAPELLKENEQLNDCFVVGDEGVNPVARFYGNKTERKVNAVKFMRADDDARENIQLKALNAELLEALKESLRLIKDLGTFSEVEEVKRLKAIAAKAEGKTLVV